MLVCLAGLTHLQKAFTCMHFVKWGAYMEHWVSPYCNSCQISPYIELLNQAHAHSRCMASCGHTPGFLRSFNEKCECVCVPTYLHIYQSLSVHTNWPTWTTFQVVNTAFIHEINPTISYCASKLQFEGGFPFQAQKWVWQLTKDIESGFNSRLSGVLPEKQRTKHFRLTGSKYISCHSKSGRDLYLHE